ncbi:MAG: peptidase family protein [Rhodocyclales bacterium]|nr:peptidase family protein [Rhodocyclales bacterium]
MHGYMVTKWFRILGAPVHFHWSVVVVGTALFVGAIQTPFLAFEWLATYLAIILVHEAGHAYFAKRLGYRTHAIYLSFIHGLCVYDAPYYENEADQVAWGGVLAQLTLALPLVGLSWILGDNQHPAVRVLTTNLGYYNLFIAGFNLLPAKGFDGEKAWRLIPFYIKELRACTAAKHVTKRIIRRVK